MPDLVAHYVASYMVSRLVYRRRLVALLVASIGILPDIDAVLQLHRWVTHSVFMLLIPFAAYLALRALRQESYAQLALLATALYGLHLLMDLFTAPLPLFWPLLDLNIGIRMNVLGIAAGGSIAIEPRISIEIEPALFTPHRVEGPVLSLVGITLLITCLATEALSYIHARTSGYAK